MIEKIRQFIQYALLWLKRVVTQPRSELDRWQRAALFTYDLSRFGARQLRHDRAPQMAAALAYRVLFGMLPVLIVATILVRAIIGIPDFQAQVESLLDEIGLADIHVVDRTAGANGEPGDSINLKEWIVALIEKAAEINLAAVGWVGLALIIYSAISLMVTIENSFNTIYRAPEGRSWVRRVPLYWFILTISPAALGLAVYLDGQIDTLLDSKAAKAVAESALEEEQAARLLDTDTTDTATAATQSDGKTKTESPLGSRWQWLIDIGGFLWVVTIEWLFMFGVYTLVPNTEVAGKPAAIGALVTVLMLEVGKRTMGAYLANAFTISHLYGSLGLVPLFMFWVYLMWLGVLFGLQVSAALQMLHGRRLDEIERKRETIGLIDPAAVLTVMEIVTGRFNQGQQTSVHKIADEASLPASVVSQIFDRLVEAGLLHYLDHDKQTVTLAQPPEQISAEQLMNVGFEMADSTGDGRRCSMLERLRDTQRKLAAQATLASLVPATPASESSTGE
ncbi:ribonuclease BN/unknown domain fusion protein [Symmachiella macrocystis]|uniref:Uncharacterized protein n=1 Tax=Symmachiella macrocystis TaxID=2527985 RepID=A0A5C6BKS9_9PLAN|nr:YhjD/YihY/BrkB family envelope integrity protein [Symmachiella macrocystis]TWU12575.1 ribonuclease BN/unknown domain fusion protein [Symmachiella macrocystis]